MIKHLFFRSLFVGFAFLITANSLLAEKQRGLSMHGDLKYREGEPFSYLNPHAKKGGTIRFGVVGTFNSTNPFITKGTPPPGLSLFSEQLVFEGLMKRSYDEPFSLYGLIAEAVDVAEDRSSMTFYLNPKAQWSDGHPVLAEDVQFTFETFRDKGTPNRRLFFKRVESCEIIDPHTVRFTFKKDPEKGYDPEQPLLMALMQVIPKHVYKDRDFEKVTLEKVIGSGPYKIKSLKAGHSIVYERRADYWGRDRLESQGEHNFDIVAIEYYRDSKVAYEAFKAGEYDIYRKMSPSSWRHEPPYPALQKGLVKQISWSHQMPVGFQGLAMNTRRDLFKDRRVRKALTYAFDFETLNRNLFDRAYRRSLSYFPNTSLAATGLPDSKERELLEPFRKSLPSDVFEKELTLPVTDGRGGTRKHLQKARHLLEEAGWHIDQGTLRHQKTKQPFTFEILLYSAEHLKFVMPFVKNLKALGIKASPRVVDTAHYETRRLNYDYDMIVQLWGHTMSPGNEQAFYWSTEAGQKPGSRNYPGISCPAVDALCRAVAHAKTREDLTTALHALDRVLWHGWYAVPLFHTNEIHLAYWDKFGYPEVDPKVGVRFSTWWSEEK